MTHLCGLYVRVVQRQNGPKPKRPDARARTPGRQVARRPGGQLATAARFAFLLRNTPIYRAALRAAGGQLGGVQPPGEGLGGGVHQREEGGYAVIAVDLHIKCIML